MVFGRMRAQAVICVAVLVLPGCRPNPAQDPATLAAIRAEARALMANPHVDASSRVPESHWPRTIGSLRPEWVRIDEDGVDIPVKVYFDDSWGYWVPRDPARLPGRRSGYRAVGEGIYWYHFS
ncbi:hypothetical protein [Sphingomonas sp. NIBR02145]|uniref:hypothetical protein n=1 Tax=Sphingomonas sp. NIBR02145 TaxID=3014784 RepID=UPI0022B3607E|nr:hypothetical protein [Sphingomonas sp. NIBR02145]WHU01889.1 hypothetical protein O3305_17075 [Sphingomonas sp. NIBR02145]